MNSPLEKPNLASRIRIVLDHTSHPGNIGSAARAMKTMGLSRLYLVAPKRFPSPEAEAMDSGAQDVLQGAIQCETLDEALSGATFAVGLTSRQRDLPHEVLTAREAAPLIARHAKDQEVALLFGNETYGLSNNELTKCQLLVTIPANPDYPSLNLAAAVQLLSYEVALASESVQSLVVEPMGDLASLEEIEQFYQHLETTLVKIGFLDPRHPKKLMPRLRRLFARSRLEKEEINILRGILKEVNKS